MKILFLIPSLKCGGQEKAGMLLCNYLLRYHEVTALCFEAESAGEFKYECPVIRIPIASGNGIIRKTLAGIKRISRIKRIKKQLQPDVSIAFGNTAIILNAFSNTAEKKIASIRQSFSGIMQNTSLAMKLHLRLYVWGLRRADIIVAVSNAINAELKAYFNIVNEVYINNGINHKDIDTLADAEVDIMHGDKQWIVHSGRFDRSKGHWHLVKIFSAVKQKIPALGLILLGGTDTSDSTGIEIEKFCRQYLTRQNISYSQEAHGNADVWFAGHQANPFKFIKKATLFVLPSLWEGFPNALIEAMGCGVPVVAAKCQTGPEEILRENNELFGLLLPAFTTVFDKSDQRLSAIEEEWAHAITRLLQDNARLKHFGNQSIKRVEKYSVESMGHQWMQLLDHLNKKNKEQL